MTINLGPWTMAASSSAVWTILALVVRQQLAVQRKSTACASSSTQRKGWLPWTRNVSNLGASPNLSDTDKPLYWSRDLVRDEREISLPIVKKAKIISLSDPNDPTNDALHKGRLPDGAELLQIGTSLNDFDVPALVEAGVNTIFVSYSKARQPLADLIEALPSIEWIQSRNAGIDSVVSPTLATATSNGRVLMTNAKGQFSSSLAEHALAACSYFAKDYPRLLRNQRDRTWDPYQVLELRGATLGIVGYGDIGRATARLAKAYGMKVMALSRRHDKDPYLDERLAPTELNRLFQESDYVFCALPLTEETRGLIGEEQFNEAKPGCVFINVGRGPVIDEEAMIRALENGRLKGAALDVVTVEPLPDDSPLWNAVNVLLSPHNMDFTATSQSESTTFFVETQLARFARDLPLYNKVDPSAGY